MHEYGYRLRPGGERHEQAEMLKERGGGDCADG